MAPYRCIALYLWDPGCTLIAMCVVAVVVDAVDGVVAVDRKLSEYTNNKLGSE